MMPRISADQAGGANVCAFLDMLRVSEIGASLMALSDDGYNVLQGATPSRVLLFDSYAQHPYADGRPIVPPSISSAAGGYQFLVRYWEAYRDSLGLTDFGPENQDRWAIQLIRECRALPDVVAGRFDAAVIKVARIWASLPGAGYGQHENTMDHLRAVYVAAKGTLA